jgi:hypothetical protein
METPRAAGVITSIDKAFEVCEVLSGMPRGMSLSDLARSLRQPASTVHRLLAVLKKRGYVRQDDETQRYGLTLKMLDLSFRSLGQSELRLHAYPIMREYVLRTPYRGFIAIPSSGEVTYVWSTGPDEVAMRTVYGKEMPGHCAIYFSPAAAESPAGKPRQATRRLSCLRLATQSLLSAWARRPSSRMRCSACSACARRCAITPARKWRASACSATAPTTARSCRTTIAARGISRAASRCASGTFPQARLKAPRSF